MNEPLSNNQDPSPSSEEISAKLTIFVDNEGTIAYNCDWEPTEAGLVGVAAIFYKLLLDDMPSKIFDEIRGQCVLNNAETDFIAIESLLQQYATLDQNNDSVVVPPDKITNL